MQRSLYLLQFLKQYLLANNRNYVHIRKKWACGDYIISKYYPKIITKGTPITLPLYNLPPSIHNLFPSILKEFPLPRFQI